MFGIFFGDRPIKLEEELVMPASIVINEFRETLYLSLTCWNLEDYKHSWLNSLKGGLKQKNYAALVVSMYDPVNTNFIFI